MVEHTFSIGAYYCIARYDGPVPAPEFVQLDLWWSPHTPDWDSLSEAEMDAYEAEREVFLAKVLRAGVQ
jgi:hypothetical protein